MTLQLIRDGKELLGSDGIMYVDGRLGISSIRIRVKERNERFAENFPHKVATEFYICGPRLVRESLNYNV